MNWVHFFGFIGAYVAVSAGAFAFFCAIDWLRARFGDGVATAVGLGVPLLTFAALAGLMS